MSRPRHNAVLCEVCRAPIARQGPGAGFEVGRKPSHLPRKVHDRCRRRWEELCESIKATWIENRGAKPQPEQLSVEMPPAAARATPEPAVAAPGPKEEAMPEGIKLVPVPDPRAQQPAAPTRKPREVYDYKPELNAFIRDWFKAHKWGRGATAQVMGALSHAHPEPLMDRRGRQIGSERLSAHCRDLVMMDAVHAKPEPAPTDHAALAAHAARSLELAASVTIRAMELARRGDTETLKAVLDLLPEAKS